MKKLSLVFVSALLLFTGSVLANDVKKSEKPSENLSTQIATLLSNSNLVIEDELTANVLFTLNEDREIVVLSVTTNSEVIAQFVKSKLNYQKVSLENYREGRMYTVPVRLKA
ncbi:hypothetical protein I2486_01345 [Cellulophaga sp. E16_2]|uniref:Uncharacterized protein n=1 Tax=Cellulophaga algicola (strain DSM 14237 / IC166 / ACAM 630) TaxID=688270 RepID=E6X9D6_CELAD|nr:MULTISPECIES: hypothetical protein [Cellulophaga]ADV47675.1 hypothetical protein Celal_0331 [Cellulophaga algicola DSM 14237]MBO0590039.1 hypothetical protein [Cellulophaga sp. E16_2]